MKISKNSRKGMSYTALFSAPAIMAVSPLVANADTTVTEPKGDNMGSQFSTIKTKPDTLIVNALVDALAHNEKVAMDVEITEGVKVDSDGDPVDVSVEPQEDGSVIVTNGDGTKLKGTVNFAFTSGLIIKSTINGDVMTSSIFANKPVLKVPDTITYKLGSGGLDLGSSGYSGVPLYATNVVFSNDSDSVLKINNGEIGVDAGAYEVTYKLSYSIPKEYGKINVLVTEKQLINIAKGDVINVKSEGGFRRSQYVFDGKINNNLTLPITVQNVNLTVDNIVWKEF